MNKIEIPNRQMTRALNGNGQVYIPWPTEYLGEYGSHAFDGSPTTPEGEQGAMEKHVADHVYQDGFRVVSVSAGRNKQGDPIIALRVELHLCLSVSEASAKLGVNMSRVHQLLGQGRIKGAYKSGSTWMIPYNFEVTPVPRGAASHAKP